MKKHVKYLIVLISIILILITLGVSFLTFQFFKFYDSYLNEETMEIQNQMKLVEWAVTPVLKNNREDQLKQFSRDLYSDDIAIVVDDSDGNIVLSSRPDIEIKDFSISKISHKTLKNYKKSLKNKMIVETKSIVVNNKLYTIKVALLEENMIKTFLQNQFSIIFITLLGLISIIWFSLYVIHSIKVPFDKLQESALKITNGNLDVDIYQIDKGILSQHSKTINDMATQLKNKINNLKFLESCKNQMLQGISHEIKTPLTSIVLASELLMDNNSDKAECIELIKSNSDRLNSLVQSIIETADLEDIKLQNMLKFDEFKLNDVIYTAVNNIELLVNNIKVNLFLEEDVLVSANASFLETAITNILSNAIKYSESDRIDITLKKENNNAIISIKDYGIGIDKEHQNKIFDRFYRVDKDKSRELGGNGLGLTLVQQIVELHNGEVTVESELGKGCNFIMTLPIVI